MHAGAIGRAYFDPIIEVLLEQINLEECIRLPSGVDEPIVEDDVTEGKVNEHDKEHVQPRKIWELTQRISARHE